jgi:predicted MFS family arabinose efflux permease
VVAAFAVAIVMLVAFAVWERRSRHPMLPLEYFRKLPFSTGTVIITFGFLVMFGFFFLVTQYFQFVRGYSPLKAGIATLPFAATMIVVSPRGDTLVKRFGLNNVVAGGFGCVAAGFLILTVVHPTTSYLVVVVSLILLAAGMAITIAPATGAIMASVPLNKAGVGSAVNDTTRELGGALGIAVLGSVVASAYRGHVDVSNLPPEAAAQAKESIGGAIRVAQSLDSAAGAELVRHAGSAYTDAFNVAMGTSAAISVLIGVIVLFLGRKQET